MSVKCEVCGRENGKLHDNNEHHSFVEPMFIRDPNEMINRLLISLIHSVDKLINVELDKVDP